VFIAESTLLLFSKSYQKVASENLKIASVEVDKKLINNLKHEMARRRSTRIFTWTLCVFGE
jgi:hypothetical protein